MAWWWGAFALVVALCVALIAAGLHFYRVAVRRNPGFFWTKEREAEEAARIIRWPEGACPVSLTARDGLKLLATLYPAEKSRGLAVVLVHGYTMDGASMLRYAAFYHDRGYDVLLPDLRGHGQSEGAYVGFGWHDRLDVIDWVRWLAAQGSTHIVLHGESMGAATVLMASGEAELSAAVFAIVADCGYASISEQLAYQLKRAFRLPPFPMLPVTSLITRIRAGYGFGEGSALRAVSGSKTPTLIIHGEADDFVPVDMARRLYAACAAQKRLYLVPGAGHAEARAADPAGYDAAVAAFLDECGGVMLG